VIAQVTATYDLIISRFTPQGELDTTFNGTGAQTLTGQTYALASLSGLHLMPDDSVVLIAFTGNNQLIWVNADGSLRESFGQQGRLDLPLTLYSRTRYQIGSTPDGGLLVLSDPRAAASFRVTKLTATGEIDTAFGVDGIALGSGNDPSGLRGRTMLVDSEGNFTVATPKGGSILGQSGAVQVSRWLADGTPDTTFGEQGQVLLEVRADWSHSSAIAQWDSAGRLLVGISCGPSIFPQYTAVMRLLPNGDLDTSFGLNGLVLSGGTSFVYAVVPLNSGEIAMETSFLPTIIQPTAGFVRVQDGAPTATFNVPAGPEGGNIMVSLDDPADSLADLAAGFTYSFDLDNDGVYEITGSQNWAAMPAALVADGNSTRTVRARITDQNGKSSLFSQTLTIQNVAPTLTVTGPDVAWLGKPYALTLEAQDPGEDTITQWTIDWGDGVIDTLPGSTTTAWHTFTAEATGRAISVTATDEDGSYTQAGPVVDVGPLSIASLQVTPDSIDYGQAITLSALGVSRGATAVAFYHDANDNGLFEPALDTLLGADSDGADGWSWSGDSTPLFSSVSRLFARATAGSDVSNPVQTTVHIEAPLPIHVQGSANNGLLVIEAEFDQGNTAWGNVAWTLVEPAGASNRAMQVLPNNGVGLDNYLAGPRLDYRIEFTQTGVHYLWLRGMGATSGDDSVHLGLDGQAISTADRAVIPAGSSFKWSKASLDGPVLTINVTTPGLHTLNLYMREDGAVVDRILLTTSSSYNPGTGVGPAATLPVGAPSNGGSQAQVYGNGQFILDDFASNIGEPSPANFTDFGDVTLDAELATRTYTVTNAGAATLITADLTVPPGFVIVEGLSANIAPGGSDTFTVGLPTDQLGDYAGAVSFLTNARGLSPFNFNIAGSVVEAASGVPAYIQDAGSNGLVVIEAELNDGNTAINGIAWTGIARSGASGSAMQVLPNSGSSIGSNIAAASPRLDYRIQFNRAGVHYLWLRGLGLTSGDDSVHVGLDGDVLSSSDNATITTGTSFNWTSKGTDGAVLTINVPSAGMHTLNLWMREDGAIVDRILLTSSSSYKPSGTGPAASTRQVLGGPPEVAVQGNGQDILDNSATPAAANHTQFGSVVQGQSLTRTFTVTNAGFDPLNLSNLTVPEGFAVVEGLSPTLAAGQSDTFTVRLNSEQLGSFSGQITFQTNDADEGLFNFAISGSVIEAPTGEPAYIQDSGSTGLVVIEAELNDGNTAINGIAWTGITRSGASGSAMQVLPNNGSSVGSNIAANSPRLDYRIQFNRAGVHYLWLRGLGLTSGDDSVHVGLDGVALSTSDNATITAGASFNWTSKGTDGAVLTINVPSAGVHTLNLWMREDGAMVDRILLTSSSSYAPTGTGPATSARALVAAAAAMTTSAQPSRGEQTSITAAMLAVGKSVAGVASAAASSPVWSAIQAGDATRELIAVAAARAYRLVEVEDQDS
jgi:uncharacterized delta-60 repeat protein